MSKYAELFRTIAKDQAAALPNGRDPVDSEEVRERFCLLFVDDEPGVLHALTRIFFDEDYRILTAGSADEALQVLAENRIHLLVTDHRMPGMTGAQLLKEVKERWPDTIRIMLTGYADVQSIMGAVNEGAVFKFITKPWHDEDLRLTVSLALHQYMLMQENKELKKLTQKQNLRIKNYSALMSQRSSVLGHVLTKARLITSEDFQRALKERREEEFIIDTLVRLGIATESKVVKVLQDQLNLEYVDLKEMPLNSAVVKFLPRDLCEKNRFLPIQLDNRQLTLAMADPSDIFKADNVGLMTGLRVTTVIARSSDIVAQLRKVYGDGHAATDQMEDFVGLEPIDEVDIVIEEEERECNVAELISSSEIPPVIRIVNAIISEAIRYRASDIHLEPKPKHSVVRFRIDGILHSKLKLPAELHPAIVSRVKILARLDIAERRKPQDGRIAVKSGTRLVDIRVSSMPTINGEKVVLRILDKSGSIRQLKDLGVLPDDLQKVLNLTKRPQGMIISTGPTGSGKTTMLYSILNEMLQSTKNFETIEDPVEYFLEDANQVYVLEKIGLSFASVLRATLRQDPDVILVGEIRDQATADVAFKAALTGHMVLTTLHTNNSVASITRLIDIGVKPYLIASALEGIFAQRLVRRICRHCRVAGPPDPEHLELLKIPEGFFPEEVFRGQGCPRCSGTGYLGRTGIFELFVMNDDFRHFISESYRESELYQMARSGGMRTLIEDGAEKVRQGETTLDELLRVLGTQIRHERTCPGCRRTIEAKFIFCPYCGAVKQNICLNCRMPMEEDWVLCAFCGRESNSGLPQR